MPDWMKFAGGWTLAVLTALAFSWSAVAQVRNRVIQPSIEIPAAATATTLASTTSTPPTVIRVEPSLIEGDPGPTTTVPPEGTSGSSQVSTTATTAPDTSTAPAPTVTTTTTQAPAPTTSTTTTTAPPQTTTTTTVPPQTTTTTTTAPPQSQTESYTLTGGVVTISYSPGVVNLVSAIPQPGFGTDPRETGPDRVRIRFESDDHTSDFRAEWESGELQITKNETGEG